MKKEFNQANKGIIEINAVSPVTFNFTDGNLAHCIVQDCQNGKLANDKARDFYKRVMELCNKAVDCNTVNDYVKVAFEGYKKNNSLYPDAKITHIKDTDKRTQYQALQELNAFRSYLLTLEELRVVKQPKEQPQNNDSEKGDSEENETQEQLKKAAQLSPAELVNGLLIHFHENGKATKALLKFQKDFIG